MDVRACPSLIVLLIINAEMAMQQNIAKAYFAMPVEHLSCWLAHWFVFYPNMYCKTNRQAI